MLLKNKKILLGVTGSIAIYKALELIRLFIKQGAQVRVVMSEGACKFINPITFEAISQNKVLIEDNENWDKSQDYNHIDIGKWADVFVLAPLSANSINSIANGLANNLLLQTVLAYNKTIFIAPAANTNMVNNQITKQNLQKLQKLNFEIISTVTKELVCKDIGDGAMAEVEDIFHLICRNLLQNKYWKNTDVVLSGGGTIEKIDEVRYISNFSSGKMASSLAKALYYKGSNVTLVSTRGYENLPKSINIKKVQSSNEMYDALKTSMESFIKKAKKKPYLFKVAAVSDYIPSENVKGKLKKEDIGKTWNLDLKQNIDLLGNLDKKDFISVGFKAEMDKNKAFSNAKSMLDKKDLDVVCLNILDETNNFGSENNKIEMILKEKSYKIEGNKLDISFEILDKLRKEFK